MIIIKIERWKNHPTIAHCKVSSLGRVKYRHKIVRQYVDNNGYLAIFINNRVYKVHRLVAESFLGLSEIWQTVDHLDRNRRNNELSNLEVVSELENSTRAKEILVEKPTLNTIMTNTTSVNLEDIIDFQNNVLMFNDTVIHSYADLYKTLGLPQVNVCLKNLRKAINNKTKYCGGFWILQPILKEKDNIVEATNAHPAM